MPQKPRYGRLLCDANTCQLAGSIVRVYSIEEVLADSATDHIEKDVCKRFASDPDVVGFIEDIKPRQKDSHEYVPMFTHELEFPEEEKTKKIKYSVVTQGEDSPYICVTSVSCVKIEKLNDCSVLADGVLIEFEDEILAIREAKY